MRKMTAHTRHASGRSLSSNHPLSILQKFKRIDPKIALGFGNSVRRVKELQRS
ncbi:hypothetical protein EKH55_3331 [Sinorhizobium alkalisoli]|nr:hypothetical protein EKH55_3331 [Sinorhizobium alkalisoli]